jgi:hypothetical protein
MSDASIIELQSGRRISLDSLTQSRTYAGLLEGLPTVEMSQRIIDRLIATERERGWWVGEPYLIPPVFTPLEFWREKLYPFGEPAAIPQITCVGRFRSFPPARDPEAHYSELTVIWFQDQFAFPLHPGILEHLRLLDWDRLARDFAD